MEAKSFKKCYTFVTSISNVRLLSQNLVGETMKGLKNKRREKEEKLTGERFVPVFVFSLKN